MPRSSFGSRRATTWTTEHNNRPTPRIVRLGRPANDNIRKFGHTARVWCVALAASVTIAALVHWGLT